MNFSNVQLIQLKGQVDFTKKILRESNFFEVWTLSFVLTGLRDGPLEKLWGGGGGGAGEVQKKIYSRKGKLN